MDESYFTYLPSLVTPGPDELVKLFLDSQDIKPESRKVYSRALNQYLGWVSGKGYSLDQMDRIRIIQYKEELLIAGKSVATVCSYLNSLRRFYDWTSVSGYGSDISKGIKYPKRKQEFKKQPLSVVQGPALLSHFETGRPVEYAVVNLLLRTGLRTIEIIRADIGDIIVKGGKRILMVHGKGRDSKDEFVKLTDKAFKPIEVYLRSRGITSPSDPLFVSDSNNSRGKRLTTRTIRKIVKEGLVAIGLNSKHYTAHSLRHTAAVNILRAGGNLETVQGILRHSSVDTTAIYTQTIKDELRLNSIGEELLDNIY